jgi:glyoxylase-like metal-dependent hydrolase (beta-lactamase superfamily II)
MTPQIRSFFDPESFTVTYLVWDPATRRGVIIDPVLDFDPASGRWRTTSADAVLAATAAEGVSLDYVLETHAHADHLSAAQHIRAQTGARIGIGDHIVDVQSIFVPVFAADDVKPAASDFDILWKDGEKFAVGDLVFEVMHTPGHTPADVSYLVGDNVFVGDTLFMPDYGTARADFPGGDAATLYRSIHRLLALPPNTTLWMCHDYKAPGRDSFAWQTTVAAQRASNVHVHAGVSEQEFVDMRRARDLALPVPRLLLPSVQVNIRAGRFPPADDKGRVFLKLPVQQG